MSVHVGGRGPGHTSRKTQIGSFTGGGEPPVSYTPGFDFSDARNSQYLPLALGRI